MTVQTMNPLEDPTSWKIFQDQERQYLLDLDHDDEVLGLTDYDLHTEEGDEQRRQLWGDVSHPLYSKRPTTGQRKKKKKKKTPNPKGKSVHAMMIDAGSSGTRIHIYEYDRRVLASRADIIASANGEKLSFPTTNSRWTNKFRPGLDSLAKYEDDNELTEQLSAYLGPLIEFAREVLSSKKKEWNEFPIFLKATGGMRQLSTGPRVRIITTIRKLFHNKTFNPFSFEDERARVISGEEEAIYGWAAVNFVKGSLVKTSLGTGTVLNPNSTIGSIEMGGASTQIGLFMKNGDVMANLFKLQIGAARHWNVYVHSFLYFGINSAYSRLNAILVAQNTTANPCLPSGSAVQFDSWFHMNADGQFLPRSSPLSTPYSVTMMNNGTTGTMANDDNFNQCSDLTYRLLRKNANNEWVVFSHDGDCSFAGVYQPPLPITNNGIDEYIATGNYVDILEFLQLGSRVQVSSIKDEAKKICALSWDELQQYNEELSSPIDDPYELAQYCFRSIFAYQVLRNGYGFPDDFNITVLDVLNGQKISWALGSVLYEINTLPWEFHHKLKVKEPSSMKAEESRWSLLSMAPGRVTGPTQTSIPWTIAFTVLVTSTTIWMLTTFRQRWQNRQLRSQYQNLDIA